MAPCGLCGPPGGHLGSPVVLQTERGSNYNHIRDTEAAWPAGISTAGLWFHPRVSVHSITGLLPPKISLPWLRMLTSPLC